MLEAFFALADTLRVLIQLRLMFAGLIAGSILGIAYKKLVHGSVASGAGLGSSPGDDAVVIATVVGALIGMAFDIRRGLKG